MISSSTSPAVRQAEALASLLALLRHADYRFVTPTPATHGRVLARRPGAFARNVTDALGWSMPFDEQVVGPAIFACLKDADMLAGVGDGFWKSRVRVSSLGGRLYLHSAYPTDGRDAVFFGPDSYRFADLIVAELDRQSPAPGAMIVDIGTGSGVGAVVAGDHCADARLIMTDINPTALFFAAVNARAAGLAVEAVECRCTAGLEEQVDIALANPPYIVDDEARAYRDGGALHGGAVSLEIAGDAVERLRPGGRLILYTGSAIVEGKDLLRGALMQLAEARGCTLAYREMDPDVFGEELERPAYRDVDRIAIIAAVLTRSGS